MKLADRYKLIKQIIRRREEERAAKTYKPKKQEWELKYETV